MQFDSVEYGLFLACVVTAFYAVPVRWRTALVLAASAWFYARWNAAYLILIAASALTDYVAGRLIGQERWRLRALLASLVVNLGLLGTFKYGDFLLRAVADVGAVLGAPVERPVLDLVLPVGISFYTFQTLSYTIDRYRGDLGHAERDPVRFGTYVLFFPQLVAGPIERAAHLLPQLAFERAFDAGRVSSGLQLILWGLFKKVVIADRLALYVDSVYGNVQVHNASSYLLATWFFAIQIYCDFSGYTDMAIGSARSLGVDLGPNFERPYFARSPREFWRRWHITLSTWLRDYLYIPLGGSRRTRARTASSLLVTMLLGGLWHGAAWTFVVWGAFHGALLVAQRSLPAWFARVPDGIKILVTFQLVCVGWVFFRATSMGDATLILGRIATFDFGRPFLDVVTLAHALPALFVLLLWEVFDARRSSPLDAWARSPRPIRWAGAYALIVAVVLFGVQEGSPFIYFQF